MSDLRNQYESVVLANYAPQQPVFTHGRGAELFDEDGRRYIDFCAGVAVCSLGHAEPSLAAAIGLQAQKLIHVSNNYVHDRIPPVAARLVELAGLDRVFFCNSGTEANECALKIARKRGVAIAAGKHRVISFQGSFHGRLGMSLAASGQPKLWASHGPQSPGFEHLPFGEDKALRQACAGDLCAIIVEPIQGEGGVNVCAQEFLQLLREQCDSHDALLIIDEIQCGMGRTGVLFRSRELGVTADLLTLAKGLGGGFPVGATLAGARAMDVFSPGDHGTTYGANALAMVAVETVLKKVAEPAFLAEVRHKGNVARIALELFGRPVQEIRGTGLMLGIKLAESELSGLDAASLCLKAGVLVIPAAGNTIRVLPPLNIDEQLLLEGIAKIKQAITR